MNNFFIILITLLLCAFFSGMEIAFISSNKLKIEVDKKQGGFGSGIISLLSQNPGQYIATMLVGNNVSLVVYGIFMAIILEPLIIKFTSSDVIILILQTIISTLIILLTAEFLPKTLFIIKPNIALKIFAIPVIFFYIILYPVSKLIISLSSLILRAFTGKHVGKKMQSQVFSKIDLNHLISEANVNSALVSEEDHELWIFQNALDFSKVKLRDCMVPRTEVVSLEISGTIEDLRQKFIETGLSKILIYRESIDNIIGYIHSKELFKNPGDIVSRIISLPIVPETMPANKLLQSFIKEHKNIALVVDEFGGTSGIVTMEDIIEEIFGEIEDEHDKTELIEKKINDNEYIFSGRHEIDYLNENYRLGIPESDEYDTLAGLILFHYENIPKVNEKINLPPFIFKILDVSETRIEMVHLTRISSK